MRHATYTLRPSAPHRRVALEVRIGRQAWGGISYHTKAPLQPEETPAGKDNAACSSSDVDSPGGAVTDWAPRNGHVTPPERLAFTTRGQKPVTSTSYPKNLTSWSQGETNSDCPKLRLKSNANIAATSQNPSGSCHALCPQRIGGVMNEMCWLRTTHPSLCDAVRAQPLLHEVLVQLLGLVALDPTVCVQPLGEEDLGSRGRKCGLNKYGQASEPENSRQGLVATCEGYYTNWGLAGWQKRNAGAGASPGLMPRMAKTNKWRAPDASWKWRRLVRS